MPEPWHQRPVYDRAPDRGRETLAAHPQLVENFAPWLRLQSSATLGLVLHSIARELDTRGCLDAPQLVLIGDVLVRGRETLPR